MPSVITPQEANAFLGSIFNPDGGTKSIPPHTMRVVELGEGTSKIQLDPGPTHLRPGGFVSGPTQMGMADLAIWMAIFSKVGITPMAMTVTLNFTFLRPCKGDLIIATGELTRLGRTMAMGEVDIRAEGAEGASCRASGTFALPQPT